MRVMLTKDVANVGKAGDVKEVTDGYGRNFLLPRKLAVPAHKGVEAEAQRLRDAAVKRETKDRVEAQHRQVRRDLRCHRGRGHSSRRKGDSHYSL